MSSHSQDVIQRICSENTSIFVPGSIEEHALKLASSLVGQNNIATARDIIVNLSIPEEIKDEIISNIQNESNISVSLPLPPPPPSLQNSKALPVVPNAGSMFVKRSEENKKLLADVIAKKEVNKKPKVEFEVPAIIKTYDVPPDEDIKKEKMEKITLEKEMEHATNMFQRLEIYMNKAYSSNDSSLIASAERQFDSLQKRYPAYVENRADHIATLRAISSKYKNQPEVSQTSITSDEEIKNEAQKVQEIQETEETEEVQEKENTVRANIFRPAESYEAMSAFDIKTPNNVQSKKIVTNVYDNNISKYNTLKKIAVNDIEIHPGMTITSEHDTYSLIEIREGLQHDVSFFFEGKKTGNRFSVTLNELKDALKRQDLDPDSFFNSHIIKYSVY